MTDRLPDPDVWVDFKDVNEDGQTILYAEHLTRAVEAGDQILVGDKVGARCQATVGVVGAHFILTLDLDTFRPPPRVDLGLANPELKRQLFGDGRVMTAPGDHLSFEVQNVSPDAAAIISGRVIGDVSGTYRPCPVCGHPAATVVDGVPQSAPGGTTLEWADEYRSAMWISPHDEGCPEAARPNDPTGKRITLPASTITGQSFELNGVRFGDAQ